MLRACATLFLFASLAGCGLAHERNELVHPTPVHDAGLLVVDAAPIEMPDAGSCTEFWRRLPSCPASTASAIGQTCTDEGATCGVECCEPGPPIACVDGRWAPAMPSSNCSTVDCAAPIPCGPGECAHNRICLRVEEELTSNFGTCVVPPAPIPSCSAAPAGSLTIDERTCLSCRCSDQATGPVVTLSCDCCDL